MCFSLFIVVWRSLNTIFEYCCREPAYIVRNDDGCQLCASLECLILNYADGAGCVECCQLGASLKGLFPYCVGGSKAVESLEAGAVHVRAVLNVFHGCAAFYGCQ